MNNRRTMAILGSALVGAGIMYLADPVSGKRRMSLIRDKAVSCNRKVQRTVTGRAEDLKNRLYGFYCEMRSFLGSACHPSSSTGEDIRPGMPGSGLP